MLKKKVFSKKILSFVTPVLLGITAAIVISLFFSRAVVKGNSMYPNLHDKENLLLLKKAKINRFSVVVFSTKGVVPNYDTYFVKRVIGLPGDTIRYDSSGNLFVNGKKKAQNFITHDQRTKGTLHTNGLNMKHFNLKSLSKNQGWSYENGDSYKIPKNFYFVMGDNRKVSYDSRFWGLVPRSNILGVAKVLFWKNNSDLINDY